MNIEKIKSEKTINELLEFSIINLDKPSGPTSFQTDQMVGRLFGSRKFSHFGTLDPKVTGILPIALNRACKLTGWFMRKDKTYVGIMRLHSEVSEETLKKEIKNFVGKIKQTPPLRSRVKIQERERTVYYWKILEFDKDKKQVLFEVKCEAGTYIRKLIHDLGLKIGGAHMAELRRTEAGIFKETDDNFVNLYELEEAVKEWKSGDDEKLKALLIPGEIISEILPVVDIKSNDLKHILTGKPIINADLKTDIKDLKKGQDVVVTCNERFIEIAEVVKTRDSVMKPKFVLN